MTMRDIKIRERRNGALATIGTVNVDAITVASFDLSNPLHAQWLQAAIDAAQTAQVLAAVVRQPDGSVSTLDCPNHAGTACPTDGKSYWRVSKAKESVAGFGCGSSWRQ